MRLNELFWVNTQPIERKVGPVEHLEISPEEFDELLDKIQVDGKLKNEQRFVREQGRKGVAKDFNVNVAKLPNKYANAVITTIGDPREIQVDEWGTSISIIIWME